MKIDYGTRTIISAILFFVVLVFGIIMEQSYNPIGNGSISRFSSTGYATPYEVFVQGGTPFFLLLPIIFLFTLYYANEWKNQRKRNKLSGSYHPLHSGTRALVEEDEN